MSSLVSYIDDSDHEEERQTSFEKPVVEVKSF